MKILTEGHKYTLDNFEDSSTYQEIQFIEKELDPTVGVAGALKTVNDGTTNEEVLAVLINRLQYLYYKFPSKETFRAIESLEYALEQLERRTKDRTDRGVEGKHLP